MGSNKSIRSVYLKLQYFVWKLKKTQIAPPLEKQSIVKEYARLNDAHVFVETGTYRGDMINAVKNVFNEIYSIELDEALYSSAKRRFSKHKNIHIMKGDSRQVLPGLINTINQRCVFWLDAHYSGGITANKKTPVKQELLSILSHSVNDHIILVDDAMNFTGKSNYPSINDLRRTITKIRPDVVLEINLGIIRIYKP